jgi:hypothetical protein
MGGAFHAGGHGGRPARGTAVIPDRGQVLLVGSIARPEDGWTVEEVFRHSAATLGDYASALPDGEVGDRSTWITYIARHAYHLHPDLLTLSRHTFEDWKPRGYDDQWRFGIREGVEEITFEKIGYADEALRSYEIFTRLREAGQIPRGIRFLVTYPLSESAVRAFFNTARDFEIVWRAYNEAVRRELARLAAKIPHEDLAIQFDMARETAAVEEIEFNFPDGELRRLPHDPLARCCEAVAELASAVPEPVWLGLHVCYGSLGHKEGESPDSAHFKAIPDLSVPVRMANACTRAAGRSVQYVHMPVQLSDLRDGFYAPLDDLDVGHTRLYLGLVDLSDGVDGALRRVELARRHVESFGVGTPCGWGRRPLSQQVQDLLDLNRDVAEAVAGIVA